MVQGVSALLQQKGDNNAEEEELTGEEKAAAIQVEEKMQLLRK